MKDNTANGFICGSIDDNALPFPVAKTFDRTLYPSSPAGCGPCSTTVTRLPKRQ